MKQNEMEQMKREEKKRTEHKDISDIRCEYDRRVELNVEVCMCVHVWIQRKENAEDEYEQIE